IINELQKRRSVVRLLVGHNALGDDGFAKLFEYLCGEGCRHPIEEIQADHTQLGSAGLRAISQYLDGNQHLRSLQLQSNLLSGDVNTIPAFTAALNTSRLHSLTISNNYQLSDSFAADFFPYLTSPYLGELFLSAVGLGESSGPLISALLCSPHCPPFRTLTLNGNDLGYPSVADIIHASVTHQFHLRRLELYSNWHSPGGGWEQWIELRNQIARVTVRNEVLANKTREQALALLRCARPALLRPVGACLPPELLFHVFTFVAPTLSSAQRIRIIDYAADPDTLLAAEKPLPGLSQDLPAVSSSGLQSAEAAEDDTQTWRSPYTVPWAIRDRWLAQVKCDAFDASGLRTLDFDNL
ncbi:hypothetical protein K488DRAFT_61684, partial [Vararia minispora EC-137]